MTTLSIWELRHMMALLNEHNCPICAELRKKLESAIAELEVFLNEIV